MAPTHNVRHLKKMLFRNEPCGHPDDKSALRFALHFLTNLPKAPDAKLPYWRYVEYTDDGCATYECLSCKSRWEGRGAPGGYDCYMEVDGPGEGILSYENEKGGVKRVRHYKKRPHPLYMPDWKYCPRCGVEWIGPIRCGVDNERMLGPKRLRQERGIRERDYQHHYPTKWWVIQEKIVWDDDREHAVSNWQSIAKYKPVKFGAVKVLQRLNDERGYERSDNPFSSRKVFRVVMMDHQETVNKSIYERTL